MLESDAIAENRESWNARVAIHLRSALYRPNLEALRSGGHCLEQDIVAELGDVAGLDVLHLQCHIGLDTLSLARCGARVTGLDFSQPAVDAARSLADELDIAARFVVSTVDDASAALPTERFDLVFATEGVLCWIPDLRRWMSVAASMLRPGGRLYLMDGHPLADVFDDDPVAPQGIAVRNSYFNRGPHACGPGPTYADDGSNARTPATVQFTPTVGDIITAAIEAGLQIETFRESPRCGFRKFAAMTTDNGQDFHFPPPLRDKLPMSFSLTARRPSL